MTKLHRRDLLKAAGAGAFFQNWAAERQSPPNIILINTDDQRFDTIRALGNPDILTPNLDGLVRRGFTFTNFYSQGSMVGAPCLPSRTMLMTGRSLFRIPTPKDTSGHYPLLPKALEAAGYETFHIGKRGNTFVPASEAFQKTIYSDPSKENRAQQSQIHADAVIDYVRRRKPGKPFFIYLAPPVPHDPRVAPKEFMDMYDPAKIPLPKNFMPRHPFDNGELEIRDEQLAPVPRTPELMRRHIADYYACITCLDSHLARIYDALVETGNDQNTIAVFTSDQGLAVGGRHGLMGKQNLYEEFKSPLIVAGPDIPHGQSDALVYMHDLFPTICGLVGAKTPEAVEGANLAPIIKGEKQRVRDYLFAAYKDCQRMIRDDRWKMIWYPKINRFQLFDLASDPWEIDDLSGKAEHRTVLASLRKRMAEYQKKYDDKFAPSPGA